MNRDSTKMYVYVYLNNNITHLHGACCDLYTSTTLFMNYWAVQCNAIIGKWTKVHKLFINDMHKQLKLERARMCVVIEYKRHNGKFEEKKIGNNNVERDDESETWTLIAQCCMVLWYSVQYLRILFIFHFYLCVLTAPRFYWCPIRSVFICQQKKKKLDQITKATLNIHHLMYKLFGTKLMSVVIFLSNDNKWGTNCFWLSIVKSIAITFLSPGRKVEITISLAI